MLLHSWRVDSSRVLTNALLTAHFLLFVAILWIPRTRKKVVTSIDGVLADRMTRRTALATVVGAAGLVATEFALSKTVPIVKAALAPQRPKSNVLLITFDALAAEDMSTYGYRLPTTPNIDAFARNATVFKNFYSASTFTTPSIATMLTGVYPSEHRVYQIIGRVQPGDVKKSLPHQMRAGGFATGAFLSNPYAYYLVDSLRSEYDFLPEPTFQKGGLQHLWEATASLHQNSGIGNRMDEYNDLMTGWNFMGGLPLDLFRRYPATESFAHGAKILDKLPDGFFLWIHVMTPHSPYHPDAASRGTFISEEKLRKFEDEGDEGARRWYPYYPPDQQPEVDLRRLAYDEFILTADRILRRVYVGLREEWKSARHDGDRVSRSWREFRGRCVPTRESVSDSSGDSHSADSADAGTATGPKRFLYRGPDGAGADDSGTRRPAQAGLDARQVSRSMVNE